MLNTYETLSLLFSFGIFLFALLAYLDNRSEK